jgi:pimeloyl-ACP methyl ester carboxylesterase
VIGLGRQNAGVVKRLGIVDRVMPAGMTRERRREWASREEARAHFRTRRLFRDFTSECLEDYVRHGLVGRHGHYRLRIDPEIEYRIYRTIPHDMSRHLRQLRVPAGFVGGTQSDVLRRISMRAMRGPRFLKRRVAGGHLFPFEQPLAAAAAIQELLGAL